MQGSLQHGRARSREGQRVEHERHGEQHHVRGRQAELDRLRGDQADQEDGRYRQAERRGRRTQAQIDGAGKLVGHHRLERRDAFRREHDHGDDDAAERRRRAEIGDAGVEQLGEVTRASAALKAMPNAAAGADSAVSDAAKKVAELKPRLAPSYGTPIGRVFDLLGAIQSSSGAPTEAESRILDSATGDLREAITKLNELITTTMPRVRAALGGAAGVTAPVKAP